MPTNGETIPVAEAARLLGISVRTVKRMCDAGRLRSFRTTGGHLRVLRSDVEAFRQGSASPAPVPASSAFAVLWLRRAVLSAFYPAYMV